MSSGGWRHIIGAVCLSVIAGLGQTQEDKKHPERGADEQEAAADNLPSPIPIVIIEPDEAAVSRERAEKESKDREQRDLLAQEGMQSEAKRMADYAVAQTFLIAIGTVALIWTLCETRKVTRITREIGVAQTRAYISAFPGKIIENEDGRFIEWFISNVGNSPADNLKIEYSFIVWGKQYEAQDAHTVCVPPHSKIGRKEPINIKEVEINNFFLGAKPKIIFQGVITYSDRFTKTQRTHFCFETFGSEYEFVASPDGNSAT